MMDIVFISLAVYAIWYTMQPGEIFEGLANLLSKLPAKLHSPLFDCPICMVPWYGSIIYWIFYAGPIEDWAFTILGALGLNVVLSKLFAKEPISYGKQVEELIDGVNILANSNKALAEHAKIQSHVAWQKEHERRPDPKRTPIETIHKNIDEGHEKIMTRKIKKK